jgi:glycosyltransferase involved in cell wall biosynthesis
LRKLYPFFATRANASISISLAGLDKGKCEVIYHGRDESFRQEPLDAAMSFAEAQYGIREGFILYVSNIARYKKQLEVIEAYHITRKRGAEVSKLILAGIMVEPSYYREAMTLADELGIGDEVMYLGQVPQAHLSCLYSAASVFVFASICENCPNILIEAMACSAPIASSNREPMPEICGNAALYFDPTDPEDIADRMWQILTDETLRQKLTRNALENVNRFSWEETARKTLEVFERV